MDKWIPTSCQLPEEATPVLIWDGHFYVAKIRRGITEAQREAMRSGDLEDPMSEYWSASSGIVRLRRSYMYTSADVHGNNLVPYCWDEAYGPHAWRGQDIRFWMPLPAKPEG